MPGMNGHSVPQYRGDSSQYRDRARSLAAWHGGVTRAGAQMTSIIEHTDRTLPRALIFVASQEVTLKNHRRIQGLAFAVGVSAVVWGGIITGVVALVNALN